MHHVYTSRELRSLHAVLKEWIRLNRQLGRKWSKNIGDLPWWYNERALLSVFAGAIWCAGGRAFEEFSDLKRKNGRKRMGNGRVDLWFETSGREFRAEAKAGEVPLSKRDKQLEKMRALMSHAVADARCNPADGGNSRRLAIAFAVPYAKAATGSKDLQVMNREFLSLVEEVDHDAHAWFFPSAKNLPAHDGWICPGIVILVKLVKRSS